MAFDKHKKLKQMATQVTVDVVSVASEQVNHKIRVTLVVDCDPNDEVPEQISVGDNLKIEVPSSAPHG